jgi:hypothetical protein
MLLKEYIDLYSTNYEKNTQIRDEKSEPKVVELKIDIDVFKSKEFLTEAVDLYYRDKGQKLTNLSN